MFCVIQEIKLKKPDKGGASRKYKVGSFSFCSPDGSVSKTVYTYGPDYEAGKFERPHLESYRITIHHSYREDGKIKKKQCTIGTIGYYTLIEWGVSDFFETGIEKATEIFQVDYHDIYAMVEAKIEPLRRKITAEYHRTDEYKVRKQQEQIQRKYEQSKKEFGAKYDVDPREYDSCFNVFGELMNSAYLDEIRRNFQARQEAYRSYWKSSSSNHAYGNTSGGSCGVSISGTYTAAEALILKQFYRTLSKTFHPDLNQGKDTTKEMQLLNKLKEHWGI